MNFLVVPGPDGTVQIVETALKVSEPVKIKTKAARRKIAMAVPQEVHTGWFKVSVISKAA
ncbi:MAG: hypothetical protein ABIO40_09075 [Devosia sp.]